MSKSAALYYPNFRMNLGWLRVALLYWDRIRCIVPPEGEGGLDTRPEFATLVREKIIVNTPPKEYLDAAAQRFLGQVLPLYRGSTKKCQERLEELKRTFTRKLGSTHGAKFTGNLRGYLYRLKDEDFRAKKDGEWVVLPEYVGGLYMMCLGSVMADGLRVPLVTDTPEYERYGEFVAFGAPTPARARPDATNVLLRLEVPFPSMQSLGKVSLDRILRFREKFARERAGFRDEVEKIIDEAGAITDPNDLTDYLDERKKRIAKALDEHRATLRELKGRSLHSLLKVSCPTVVTAAAASAAGWLPRLPIRPDLQAAALAGLTLAGIGVSAYAWWAECRGYRRDAAKKCPWHYCLDVARFGPHGKRLTPTQQKAKRQGPRYGRK